MSDDEFAALDNLVFGRYVKKVQTNKSKWPKPKPRHEQFEAREALHPNANTCLKFNETDENSIPVKQGIGDELTEAEKNVYADVLKKFNDKVKRCSEPLVDNQETKEKKSEEDVKAEASEEQQEIAFGDFGRIEANYNLKEEPSGLHSLGNAASEDEDINNEGYYHTDQVPDNLPVKQINSENEPTAQESYFNRTIVVRNIKDGTPQDEIQEFFQQYGEIEEIKIEPSLCKVYIRYQTSENAQNAVREGNGVRFQRFRVSVAIAWAFQDRDLILFDINKALFVSNLPREVLDKNLWHTFSTCGEIEFVHIVRHHYLRAKCWDYGCVVFKSLQAVQRAMEMGDITIRSNTLVLRCSDIFPMAKERVDCTIFVSNIPVDASEQDIMEALEIFGSIEKYTRLCTNHAFVTFKDVECAQDALKIVKFNGPCAIPEMVCKPLISKEIDKKGKTECQKCPLTHKKIRTKNKRNTKIKKNKMLRKAGEPSNNNRNAFHAVPDCNNTFDRGPRDSQNAPPAFKNKTMNQCHFQERTEPFENLSRGVNRCWENRQPQQKRVGGKKKLLKARNRNLNENKMLRKAGEPSNNNTNLFQGMPDCNSTFYRDSQNAPPEYQNNITNQDHYQERNEQFQNLSVGFDRSWENNEPQYAAESLQEEFHWNNACSPREVHTGAMRGRLLRRNVGRPEAPVTKPQGFCNNTANQSTFQGRTDNFHGPMGRINMPCSNNGPFPGTVGFPMDNHFHGLNNRPWEKNPTNRNFQCVNGCPPSLFQGEDNHFYGSNDRPCERNPNNRNFQGANGSPPSLFQGEGNSFDGSNDKPCESNQNQTRGGRLPRNSFRGRGRPFRNSVGRLDQDACSPSSFQSREQQSQNSFGEVNGEWEKNRKRQRSGGFRPNLFEGNQNPIQSSDSSWEQNKRQKVGSGFAPNSLQEMSDQVINPSVRMDSHWGNNEPLPNVVGFQNSGGVIRPWVNTDNRRIHGECPPNLHQENYAPNQRSFGGPEKLWQSNNNCRSDGELLTKSFQERKDQFPNPIRRPDEPWVNSDQPPIFQRELNWNNTPCERNEPHSINTSRFKNVPPPRGGIGRPTKRGRMRTRGGRIGRPNKRGQMRTRGGPVNRRGRGQRGTSRKC